MAENRHPESALQHVIGRNLRPFSPRRQAPLALTGNQEAQHRQKGRIAVGADADITVFNPDTVLDRATFEAPTTPSAGISHVIVNGTFVVRDGQLIKDARPGRAVRNDK